MLGEALIPGVRSFRVRRRGGPQATENVDAAIIRRADLTVSGKPRGKNDGSLLNKLKEKRTP